MSQQSTASRSGLAQHKTADGIMIASQERQGLMSQQSTASRSGLTQHKTADGIMMTMLGLAIEDVRLRWVHLQTQRQTEPSLERLQIVFCGQLE